MHEYEGTVVAITHDRYFLDNVAGWIELDRGNGIPYEGNCSAWLEQKGKRLAQEEKQEQARQRTLANELEWIRQSPRARQAKSKARITAYESLLAEAKEKSPDTAQIIVPVGPRLGDLVIEASSLAKGLRISSSSKTFLLSYRPAELSGSLALMGQQNYIVPHDFGSGGP